MLELQHLEYLVTIEEKGTLSAAAEALHVSQPALTRAMQRLEANLGQSLFLRRKNRVELNEAGRLAVECARLVLEAAGDMERRMDAYRQSQMTIAVGACGPGPLWVLTAALTTLCPGMKLTSEVAPGEALLRGLEKDAYQFIVLDAPVERPGVLCRGYVTERLMLSVPPAHPLAEKSEVEIDELNGLTMLLYGDLGVWQRLHDTRMRGVNFIVQESREAFEQLVRASDLPCFATNLSRRFTPAARERALIPIRDDEAAIRFYLCAREKQRGLLERLVQLQG